MRHKNKWLCSYETVLFDTPDGDLGEDQYAECPGGGYYVRLVPKEHDQFEQVDKEYDVSKLSKVNLLDGHSYYNEFLTARGANNRYAGVPLFEVSDVSRTRTTATEYWNVASVKNYPQPELYEAVSKKPLDPPVKTRGHNSVAYDSAANPGYKRSVSSCTWSHRYRFPLAFLTNKRCST